MTSNDMTPEISPNVTPMSSKHRKKLSFGQGNLMEGPTLQGGHRRQRSKSKSPI